MGLLILWFSMGALCAVIAAAKGRSFIAWLLIGLLGGIFAFAYIVFASRVEWQGRLNFEKPFIDTSEGAKSALVGSGRAPIALFIAVFAFVAALVALGIVK